MVTVFLKVPYKDKDIVKILGAKWHDKEKKWFVPLGCDESRFQRWIEKEKNVNKDDLDKSNNSIESILVDTPSNKNTAGTPLSSLLFDISDGIRRIIPNSKWVIAEIASIKKNSKSNHTYIEFVEHDDTGREVAKAHACLWANSIKILKKFEKETGSELTAGMKILFLAQVEFSIQYGFSLIIEDLDSRWTLGEMEHKKTEIILKLKDLNIFDKNKKLAAIDDFRSVLVISPNNAAGLGDFKVEADRLEKFTLCSFDYIDAVFEGVSSKSSLLDAFNSARNLIKKNKYDACVIIRGGGSKTSLNWLNEFELAEFICNFEIPVIVGIGHEVDSTILDEVAFQSFDTPSKVINYIENVIVNNATIASNNTLFLKSFTENYINELIINISDFKGNICLLSKDIVHKNQNLIDNNLNDLRQISEKMLLNSSHNIEYLIKDLITLNPINILNKGFAIIKQNNKNISSIKAVNDVKDLTIEVKDGFIDVDVNLIKTRSK